MPLIETNEGARIWLRVMTELKNRGLEDILIAVADGLKGFPDAMNAVFPQTAVQTCIVQIMLLLWISYHGRTGGIAPAN